MIEEKINRTTSILGFFSVLLIAASLFVLPFPFVRAVWIREIWGITGLVHALLFVLIGNRIGKASLPASLAGIGIVLNYEILTTFGFFYILLHRGLHPNDIFFFAATLILGCFLIWLFGDILKVLYRRLFRKNSRATAAVQEDPTWKYYHETDSSALVISAAGYLIIFGLLYIMLSLDAIPQYGGLKILGVLISPLSFGGIGQEIDYYLQGKQNRFFCIIKSLTHVLVLACILWIIYRRLPLSSVVI